MQVHGWLRHLICERGARVGTSPALFFGELERTVSKLSTLSLAKNVVLLILSQTLLDHLSGLSVCAGRQLLKAGYPQGVTTRTA